METKICRKCGAEKQHTEFYNTDASCKECRKARVRQNRKDRAAYYREYDAMRFQRDPWRREANEKRAATPDGRANAKRYRAGWLERNGDKRAAHTILGNAVRRGDVLRPERCVSCGCLPYGKKGLHAHHTDYTKPLDVLWLCPKCHVEEHKRIGTKFGPRENA